MAALPPYHATTAPVTAAQLGPSWHAGCPVGPSQLRRLLVSYVGFDGEAHRGQLIVNRAVSTDVVKVFRILYNARFPVHKMRPVSVYGANDSRSTAADNTSAFNCRYAVAPGPKRWSAHAYGEAIDINTVENPYIEGGRVMPPAGNAYRDRSRYRPGMAVAGGVLVRAFGSIGWAWGGRWAATPDYQHFSRGGG
jgi:D-alanyl-D-alanine carboxypeptidase